MMRYSKSEIKKKKPYKNYIKYGTLNNEKIDKYYKVLNAVFDIYDSFNLHQKQAFDILNDDKKNKVQFRHPTGCGKGYLMIANILTNIINGEEIQTILSHRLMLNNQHILDLINLVIDYDLTSIVSFACIGSDNSIERNFFNILSQGDQNRLVELIKKFTKQNIPQSSFIVSTTNRAIFNQFFESCKAENRYLIITSTYNSCRLLEDCNIDSLYCDEAHTICNNRVDENDDSFFHNVLSLNAQSKYFFTATAKDSDGNYYDYKKYLDTKYGLITKKPNPNKYKNINDYYCDLEKYEDYLLYKENGSSMITNQFMDNEDIFGSIHEIKYTEAIKNMYITTPVIKTVLACNYKNDIIKFSDDSSITGLKGKVKAIKDTFEDLSFNCQNLSSSYNLNNIRNGYLHEMEAKLLIKCNSAFEVYHIFNELVSNKEFNDINIAYCTSSYGTQIKMSDGAVINFNDRREEFINTLQSFNLNEKLIVIHCDIMAEGINVWGFNGLLLLTTKEMCSIIKVLQNVGRTTRLLDVDRDTLRNMRKNNDNITYEQRLKYLLKPYSFVYLLQFDDVTKRISEEVKSHLNRLLDIENDYNGTTVIGLGNEDYYISLEKDSLYRENQLDKIHIGQKYDTSFIYSQEDELRRLKILDLIRNNKMTADKIRSIYDM